MLLTPTNGLASERSKYFTVVIKVPTNDKLIGP